MLDYINILECCKRRKTCAQAYFIVSRREIHRYCADDIVPAFEFYSPLTGLAEILITSAAIDINGIPASFAGMTSIVDRSRFRFAVIDDTDGRITLKYTISRNGWEAK